MNRNVRTIVKIAVIVFGTVICGALAYFISSAAVGHQLATASQNMPYTNWREKFATLAMFTGAVTGICSLAWFILSRWIFKITSSTGGGRRIIWAILAALSLVGSVAIPQIYSASAGIKVNVVVLIIFIIFFTVIGYWLLSIFTTPNAFKYTPVGAQLIRARK